MSLSVVAQALNGVQSPASTTVPVWAVTKVAPGSCVPVSGTSFLLAAVRKQNKR